MTVKQRIITFIETQKIPTKTFERVCGLSNGYLRQLKSSPTVDKVESMLSAYPQLSRNWLLRGEGEMLVPVEKRAEPRPLPPKDDEKPPAALPSEILAQLVNDNKAQIDWLRGMVESEKKEKERLSSQLDAAIDAVQKAQSTIAELSSALKKESIAPSASSTCASPARSSAAPALTEHI